MLKTIERHKGRVIERAIAAAHALEARASSSAPLAATRQLA